MSGQPYIQFGSGLLFLNPNAGNLATNPTPVKPYTLQDIKIEMKGKIESLKGQNQYPDDTATGDKDGTFEWSMGRKDFFLLNQLYNADAFAAGGISVSPNEQHSMSTGSVTVVPPGSGTFSEDLGVSFLDNNQQLTKIASGTPASGQYKVSAGVYTFAAGDSSRTGVISYSYTVASQGALYQVNNQTQGYGPAFEAFIVDTYQPVNGIYSAIRLYATKISDVSLGNKRSGYAMVDCKGSYFAAPSNRVMDLYSNV